MLVGEIISEVRALRRTDKLRVLQSLVSDLLDEEEASRALPGRSYPVWGPHGAFEAADAMLKALENESRWPLRGHHEARKRSCAHP